MGADKKSKDSILACQDQDVVVSPKVSGTKNAGTEPYKAFFWGGFPLRNPYIGGDSSVVVVSNYPRGTVQLLPLAGRL